MSESKIDENLDNLQRGANVIFDFCMKNEPSELSKDILDSKQETLFQLQQDHIRFMEIVSVEVQKYKLATTDSTTEKGHRVNAMVREDTAIAPALVRENSQETGITKRLWKKKSKNYLKLKGQGSDDHESNAKQSAICHVEDVNGPMHVKPKSGAKEIGVNEDILMDDDAKKHGLYRMALTKDQKKKDDEIMNLIARCLWKGYVAKGKDF